MDGLVACSPSVERAACAILSSNKLPPVHLPNQQATTFIARRRIGTTRMQAAGDAGQSAVEYLASVVEFDAWDKLDKDWTSNVALRNMTPENVSNDYLRGSCFFSLVSVAKLGLGYFAQTQGGRKVMQIF